MLLITASLSCLRAEEIGMGGLRYSHLIDGRIQQDIVQLNHT